jgi:hypothetical protein
MSRVILLSAVLASLGQPRTARATAGMAEWDLPSPGSNVVCHSDPFIAQHGTCLRPADKTSGVIADQTVFVAQIEWWQYFPGYVVGKAQKGFFVFNEASKAVVFCESEEALTGRLKTLALAQPLTRRLTPQDGWQLTWAPVMRQGLERLKKSEEYQKMSAEQKQAIERQLESYQAPDIKPIAP